MTRLTRLSIAPLILLATAAPAGPVANPDKDDQVWVRDVTAGTTTLASRAAKDGAPGDGFSVDASLGVTLGGPVVAFETRAGNLGTGGSASSGAVVLRTLDAGV